MMLADVVIQYFYYKLKWSEYLNISFLLAQSTQIYVSTMCVCSFVLKLEILNADQSETTEARRKFLLNFMTPKNMFMMRMKMLN